MKVSERMNGKGQVLDDRQAECAIAEFLRWRAAHVEKNLDFDDAPLARFVKTRRVYKRGQRRWADK